MALPLLVTVAVRITAVPGVAGLGEAVSVVVVATGAPMASETVADVLVV
jgi:hypothetical protein